MKIVLDNASITLHVKPNLSTPSDGVPRLNLKNQPLHDMTDWTVKLWGVLWGFKRVISAKTRSPPEVPADWDLFYADHHHVDASSATSNQHSSAMGSHRRYFSVSTFAVPFNLLKTNPIEHIQALFM